MAIFRGVGGSGDSSDNSFLQEVTAQANAASASATAAANSATSALNTELTSASFNTSDGVLTLTKQDGDTVTADLDGRFLTSYTETDPVFTAHVANGITATNISNWNTAYNNHITAVNYSGSTLTLTQQDGGTLTTTINGALGSTLVHSGSTKIEAISSGVTVTGDITVSGTVDGRDLATDGTKLDGIETNATADQTGAEIKTAYEAEADTNAFTDAEKNKLSGIEANATADQTGAEIKSAYEAVADTNAFTDAEKTKLSGIEANADVTDTVNVTAAGAVMDGDFTSNGLMKRTGAGTYTVDTSTYLTSFDITTQTDPKYLRSDADDTTTGTITAPSLNITTTDSVTTNVATGVNSDNTKVKNVNIGTGFSNGGNTNITLGAEASNTLTLINLHGDVRVNGDKLEHTFTSRFYHFFNNARYLSTTLLTLGYTYQIKETTNSKNTVDLTLETRHQDLYDTNDAEYYVSLTAPNPSDEDTVYLGEIKAVISDNTNGKKIGYFNGDKTKYFSQYCGLALSVNGSNGINTNGLVYYYDATNDRTYMGVHLYQSNPFATDSDVWLHPFDWETSGTVLNGLVTSLDAAVYDGTVDSVQTKKHYLGYFKSNVNLEIKAQEPSTNTDGNNVAIRAVEGAINQVQD
jgi:hypothetical protein